MNRLGRFLVALMVWANGLAFVSVTALLTANQGGLAWLEPLHWGSFLTDLGGLLTLSDVPSGSFWIAWLALSVLATGAYLMSGLTTRVTTLETARASAVEARKHQIEASPQVQTHRQRLDRLLGQF
jgi:hypothetical protein